MSKLVQKVVLKIFGNNPVIATIFIAMIPVIELRGAIPFGSSKEIWGDDALSVFEASVYGLIGSIISGVIIILLLIPVFKILKNTKLFKNLILTFEEKFKKQSGKIESEVSNKKKWVKKWLGVMVFVAIPLPFTGVWTGSAISVFLQMGFLKSFLAVSIGAVVAAFIMAFISLVLGGSAIVIFYIFIVLFLLVMFFYLVRAFMIGKTEKNI